MALMAEAATTYPQAALPLERRHEQLHRPAHGRVMAEHRQFGEFVQQQEKVATQFGGQFLGEIEGCADL